MGELRPKRLWPDGEERVCDGALVVIGHERQGNDVMVVAELPKEVYALKQAQRLGMIELHHHADPAVAVYVDCEHIVAIDARWSKVGVDA